MENQKYSFCNQVFKNEKNSILNNPWEDDMPSNK